MLTAANSLFAPINPNPTQTHPIPNQTKPKASPKKCVENNTQTTYAATSPTAYSAASANNKHAAIP
jgi:hypothetical protein